MRASVVWTFLVVNSALIAWQGYNVARFMRLVDNRFKRLERSSEATGLFPPNSSKNWQKEK
jgi:hypothetical protein